MNSGIKGAVRPSRIEWITFFTGMPVLTLLLNYLFFGERLWSDYRVWIWSFIIVYVQGLGSWYIHIAVMHWYRLVFPKIEQTVLRLGILAITHIALTSLTFASLFYGYDAFHFLGYKLDIEKFKMSLLLAIALTMVATTLWEAEYTIKKWKDTLAEKEHVEQLAIQQEFEALKSQVNPHFLFNCFNTLLSLIGEDKERADKFLNELSKVYRYLLHNNIDSLSTVQNEVKFIHSYFQLLITRYGEALQFKIEIDKKYEHYFLPSLSLQMLVENAVKHNALSKTKPLLVYIFSNEANELVVHNNLQPKTVNVPSNKVGLQNIKMKYELLDERGFQIIEDTKSFTVVLPLIWNNDNENNRFPGVKTSIKNIT